MQHVKKASFRMFEVPNIKNASFWHKKRKFWHNFFIFSLNAVFFRRFSCKL